MTCMDGDSISPIGKIQLTIQIGSKKIRHAFYVFEKLPFPLFIGRTFLRETDMITRERTNEFWFNDNPSEKFKMREIRGKDCFMPNPFDLSSLELDIHTRVKEFLEKYPNVATKNGSIGRTNLVRHKIEVNSEKKINVAPIFYPPRYRKQIAEQIEELLKRGFIKSGGGIRL